LEFTSAIRTLALRLRGAYGTERTLVGTYVSVSVRTKECLAPLTASFHLKLHEWTSCAQLRSAAAPGLRLSTATLTLTFNHSYALEWWQFVPVNALFVPNICRLYLGGGDCSPLEARSIEFWTFFFGETGTHTAPNAWKPASLGAGKSAFG